MSVAAIIAKELLADEDLRRALEALLVPVVGKAVKAALRSDYVDRAEAKAMGLEWATLCKELRRYSLGKKAVFKREDVERWVESRPPSKSKPAPRALRRVAENDVQRAVERLESRRNSTTG
jgi:hypothetical protein